MDPDQNKPKQKLTVQIPSYIHQIATTSDKGLKLTLLTQEIPADVQTELFGLKDMLGWMVFATAPVKPEDLVKLPPIDEEFKARGEKPLWERERAVLYIYWMQNGGEEKLGKFNDYYRKYVEAHIDRIKEQINP
jgi:hypothetical protein